MACEGRPGSFESDFDISILDHQLDARLMLPVLRNKHSHIPTRRFKHHKSIAITSLHAGHALDQPAHLSASMSAAGLLALEWKLNAACIRQVLVFPADSPAYITCVCQRDHRSQLVCHSMALVNILRNVQHNAQADFSAITTQAMMGHSRSSDYSRR